VKKQGYPLRDKPFFFLWTRKTLFESEKKREKKREKRVGKSERMRRKVGKSGIRKTLL
jgi:hypothetical protein